MSMVRRRRATAAVSDEAARVPSAAQWLLYLVTVAVVVGLAVASMQVWLGFWRATLAVLFSFAAVWRLLTLAIGRAPPDALPLPEAALPSYTIIVPLYREPTMVRQVVAALNLLDYPRHRLQVLLTLEADDEETCAAAAALVLPPGFEVLHVPPGSPRTKPRACNAALARATGELLTIYDAEDRPEPGQLREAAARFAAGPPELACLQAPLRIANGDSFLAAQFANEYAAQFEVAMPALARLGLAFPLGGTSNHMRTDVLRSLGGWDAWNVTEDADLGFRFVAAGWRTGLIGTPTWENAPPSLAIWLPQRTRWLKGYMQTLLVRTRRGAPPPRLALGLALTIGLAVLSAAAHLPAALWLGVYGVFWILGGPGPTLSHLDLTALVGGWLAALATIVVGVRRAGLPLRAHDLLLTPFYWPLLTLAFLHAYARLIFEPHAWDKTEHRPWLFRPT